MAAVPAAVGSVVTTPTTMNTRRDETSGRASTHEQSMGTAKASHATRDSGMVPTDWFPGRRSLARGHIAVLGRFDGQAHCGLNQPGDGSRTDEEHGDVHEA